MRRSVPVVSLCLILLGALALPLGAADAMTADEARQRLKAKKIAFEEGAYRSAAAEGDAETVALFLAAGMPANSGDAMAQAVEFGHAPVVKLLIEHGADKDAKDQWGQSLLMNAASNHRMEVLKALLDAKADVNVANQYGITPLAVAAEQGHLDEVKLFLASGADVNMHDTGGGSALVVAVLRGYGEIVSALIAAGADVKADEAMLMEMAAEKPEIKAILEKALEEKKKED